MSEFDTVPSLVFAPSFIDAYEKLGYDRVYITQDERDWLEKYGNRELPQCFKTLGENPIVEVLDIGGVRVGVVGFPVPQQFFEPTEEDVANIVAAAKTLQDQTDIIVGISSWGREREEFFLTKAEPVIDVLLGSGPGSGMRGRIEGSGKTYWVRTLTKGKYVLLVDAYQLPGPAADHKWKQSDTIAESFVELDVRIPDDKDVRALFQGK